MSQSQNKIWFDGTNEIKTSLTEIENALGDVAVFFTNITSLMPSMSKVKLMENGNDAVTIQTNEGVMKRNNISVQINKDHIILEFDEVYQAGKAVTTNAHFMQKFTQKDSTVHHHMIISDLKAPGFLGFFYRNFGSRNIGKALLEAHKKHFFTK